MSCNMSGGDLEFIFHGSNKTKQKKPKTIEIKEYQNIIY